jgi:hypothetical protein
VGSKAFGGLNRRLKEKTAESRWFETTGQAPFGRAKAAYWKIKISPPLQALWRKINRHLNIAQYHVPIERKNLRYKLWHLVCSSVVAPLILDL